jgi:hypothetical protein
MYYSFLISQAERMKARAEAKHKKFIRKHGIIGTMLNEIKLYILYFLRPRDLCRMTQVNKAWYLVGYELLN